MNAGDMRRRVRQVIHDARERTQARRQAVPAAEAAGHAVLDDVAAPLFRVLASVLAAEGYRFSVSTPAGAVRLSRGGAREEVIEIALDTARDPPALMGRAAWARGRELRSDERVVAEFPAFDALSAEAVLDFVLSVLPPFVER